MKYKYILFNLRFNILNNKEESKFKLYKII